MNRKVLDEIASWAVDCLLCGDKEKCDKLERLYGKMFDRQWRGDTFKKKARGRRDEI
jgi:hypothetical protein